MSERNVLIGLLKEVPMELAKKAVEDHLARYQSLIDQGEKGKPFINLPECRMYLSLWKGIEAKGIDVEKFSDEELGEYFDAVEDYGWI